MEMFPKSLCTDLFGSATFFFSSLLWQISCKIYVQGTLAKSFLLYLKQNNNSLISDGGGQNHILYLTVGSYENENTHKRWMWLCYRSEKANEEEPLSERFVYRILLLLQPHENLMLPHSAHSPPVLLAALKQLMTARLCVFSLVAFRFLVAKPYGVSDGLQIFPLDCQCAFILCIRQ